MRVVVVSEDAAERARCTSALALLDAEVTVVDTAGAARRHVEAGDADVLVVDGNLRPKGGFSLLYELSAEAEMEGAAMVPSVVLVERPEDGFLAEWAHASATVTKPVDPFGLTKVIRGLVQQPTGG